MRHKIKKLGSQEPMGQARPRRKSRLPEGLLGCGHWEATDALGKGAAPGGGGRSQGLGD